MRETTKNQQIPQVKSVIYDQAEIGPSIAALEVVQCIRHEARGHLSVAQENLALIAHLLHGDRTKASRQAREAVDRASQSLVEVGTSLDKMKAVFRPPQHTVSTCPLAELCHEAAASVQGRLAALNVKFEVVGNSVVQIYKDLLRHALLHLLFNTLDAFQERSSKAQRQIKILINPEPMDKRSVNAVLIRYTDNAGGIDFRKLKGTTGDGNQSKLDIFAAGVTSKSSGSGLGLFLARRMVGLQGGSIDLIDSKGGVVFEIGLPLVTQPTEPK